jgi:hypothetical protein
MARYILLMAVTLAWSGPAWSQSLGEAAKKEKERRAAAKKPAPAYTQDDLSTGASPKPESSPSPKPSGRTRVRADEPGDSENDRSSDSDTSSWQESSDARYKRLAAPLRDRLAYCQEVLGRREKYLKEAEEQAWREGPRLPYRAYYDEQVDRAKKAVEEQKRECDEIEDEARRQGIPPGYLR